MINPYKQLLSWVASLDEIKAGIGPLFKQARGGLGHAEFAKKLGISHTMLGNIETGATRPSIETMKRLLEVLRP